MIAFCSFLVLLVQSSKPELADDAAKSTQSKDDRSTELDFPKTLKVGIEVGVRPPARTSILLDVFERDAGAAMKSVTCRGHWLSRGPRERVGYNLEIRFDEDGHQFRVPWHGCKLVYYVNAGSVFPLMDGQIYHAALQKSTLELNNVTEKFDIIRRPAKSSLTIPGNSGRSEFFQTIHAYDPASSGPVSFQIDRIQFPAENPSSVRIEWSRGDDDRSGGLNESRFKMASNGVTTLRTGDFLVTGYKKYKVLNVVHPFDLHETGHCEGWVELEDVTSAKD